MRQRCLNTNTREGNLGDGGEQVKRILLFLLSASLVFSTTACSDTKVINGVEYDTYGLLNEDDKKNPGIDYDVVWGNVIWGVLLSETIVAPIYFFGFDLFEPVGPKPKIKGQLQGSVN